MDQNPLPRGSFQIRDRTGEELRAVPELLEAAVAVEAQYPAHPTGAMIVIKVLRVGRATDGAPTLLCRQQLVELDPAAAVAPRGVLHPRPGEFPGARHHPAARVLARLAVGRVTGAVARVSRELGQGLGQRAVRAVSVPVGNLPDGPHITIVDLPDQPGITCFRPCGEAVLAIAAAPGVTLAARTELLHRLPLAAVAATSFTVTVVQPPWHVRIAP